MIRVRLIYPYFQPKHDRSIFRFPPLGIGYVAAGLKNAGYDTDILDCTFLRPKEALEMAEAGQPDIVGIYSMVSMKEKSLWFARELRKQTALLVAGGPLPTCDPSSFMQDFDIVVRGEGEKALAEIVRAYDKGSNFHNIPGIVFRSPSRESEHNDESATGRTLFTSERDLEQDIDNIPFPARELFPNLDYISHWKKKFGHATTTVFTTRGCPFSCEFCSNAVFGISYRERSAENVVDEIEEALSFGYNHIHFADDVFTLNKVRVLHICKAIKQRKLNFTWECLGRVDSVDRDIVVAMKDAGCSKIFFGIESGNDSILNIMNKHITVAKARKAIEVTRCAGISVGAFFILCYPGETNASVLQTIRFSTSLPLDYLSFTVPYPLPGTSLYKRIGKRITKEWEQSGGFFSDHMLTFHSDFSAVKMKFGILKGQIQFWIRKNLGSVGRYISWPLEKVTDQIFKILR